MSAEKQKQLANLAKQAKRTLTLNNRKERIERLPQSPVLLSLNELAKKSELPYTLIRKMVVEEHIVPSIKVGRKYMVVYNRFLEVVNGDVESEEKSDDECNNK